jgi:hypothetical protein
MQLRRIAGFTSSMDFRKEGHGRRVARPHETRAGRSALIDASSAILLYKSGLVEELVDRYAVAMAMSVFEELTVDGYPGAELFKRLFEKKRLRLRKADDRVSLSIRAVSRLKCLGRGERETIRLYASGCGDFIIIDDGKGAAVCRDCGIPYMNALLFPRIMHAMGVIDGNEMLARIESIKSHGRYSKSILDFALNCDDHALDAFLPENIKERA